ncbi:hypothetical protein ARALYDRAFT_335545 [Arabidopsis lyrata subsp. lyrata]|uniref:Bet v I/Major latex protein domain-containing protein n=1 Tax=Arabidopsis lyrata subsp. lyrata TaxID=81972 RepID=D7KMN3_ARALL|nr:hypothetical protein ARALYDRAFT_335545 [Arabidopsis lyrata subsp. lyrata]
MAQAMRQSSLQGELEVDVEIKASAKKFHQMLSRRPQDIAKATPDIQGCALHEGEFGKVGNGQPKVGKERIEAVDHEKNLIALRVVDGDTYESVYKSFLRPIDYKQ